LDCAQYLAVVREAAGGALGKNQVAVHGNLEHAASGGDQLALHVESFLQLGRQTGGAGLVVSFPAVFDLDLHPAYLVAPLSPIILARRPG